MRLLVAGLALFGSGIVASLSPCVAPLVPGYVAVLAQSIPDGAARRQRWCAFAWFAGAVVATFAFLGALAAAVGLTITGSSAVLQRAAGAVLVVTGVAALAAEIGAARSWRLPVRLPASPRGRAIALGVGSAAAWTPCAGPLLGAALAAALASGEVWRSVVLLASYAGGVLAPFTALAVVATRTIPAGVRYVGRWASRLAAAVGVVAGIVLLSGRYAALVSGR